MDITGSSFPRLPICFCIDLTESMTGEGIEDAKNIFRAFQKTEVVALENGVCIETAIITFSNSSKCVKKFGDDQVPEEKIGFDFAGGRCSVYQALHDCLNIVREHKKLYREQGIGSRSTWIVLISDGRLVPPRKGDDDDILKQLRFINDLKSAKNNRECWFLPIQAGDCDATKLAKCCFAEKTVTFKNIDFDKLIQMLSISISQSVSNGEVGMDPAMSIPERCSNLRADHHPWQAIQRKEKNDGNK